MHRLVVSAAPLAVLALLMLSLAPAAAASTLKVDLNPSTGVSTMTSTSVTKIILTYPANTSLSNYLKGYSDSASASGSFNAGSQGVIAFSGQFHDPYYNSNVTIQDLNVSTSYSAVANTTVLVIMKQTNITATVSGVFSVVNGTVTANLGWRSFYIAGALNLMLQGHQFDVNLLGSAVTWSMAGKSIGIGLITSMFGADRIWNMATLNFTALNTPLTNWTKSYDSLSNTTTFSKTINGQASLSTSYTNNGQTYSLKAVSDPSAQIATKGYADASGNSLKIVATPAYLSPITWAVAAVVIVVLAAGAILAVNRSRRKTILSPAVNAPV
jgi:hypothetical protein